MCGILGFFSNRQKISEQGFTDSLRKIGHRGPDNTSVKRFGHGFMGHVRLAIIDLDACSNQPYSIDDRFHIVFNGEIYNYKEIKNELLQKYKETFTTNSDTEVLLRAYIRMGEGCLKMINGMYAFAIYDAHENTLFAAKDRVGKKPFYFSCAHESFLFSSELKSLLPLLKDKPALSLSSINEYLSIGYIIAPDTIYEKVYKLEPGHYLKVDLDKFALTNTQYWDPVKEKKSYDESATKSILQNAIDLRYNSDVPVGIMLSGGLDSNIVLALSKEKKPKTFTIKNEHSDYDESILAEQSARHFGCENLSKAISPGTSILDKLIYHYDEPMADSSAIPSMLLSEFIRQNGYKCVLNGDGADEIFAGYDRYKFLLLYKKFRFLRHFIPGFKVFRYKSFWYNLNQLKQLLKEKDLIHAYAEQQIINKGFEGPLLKKMNYKNEIIKRLQSIPVEGLNRFVIHDYKYYLPDDLLVKMDRATMAHAVESRSPFLDYRLAEVLLHVPFEKKISIYKNKILLRSFYADILPNTILKKKKSGFQVPIDHWFLHELRDEVLKLKTSEIIKDGFVDQEYVNKIVDAHLSKKENYKFQIYLLLIFERWYKEWVKT